MKKEIFENPPMEYRGTPFWAWNDKMDKDTLKRQIITMKEMGMGGFFIHCRTGLRTPYLSDEFMEYVAFCKEQAKEMGMYCWLYDEDRYSSGYGGGYVTKDMKYRARYLLLSTKRLMDSGYENNRNAFEEAVSGGEKPRGYQLGGYRIQLEEGYLKEYQYNPMALEQNDCTCDWFLYLTVEEESGWCNNQTYVDTLNKEAIDRFIEITHERYKEVAGDEFGAVVPGIFTDEPNYGSFGCLKFAEDKEDITIPFTDDIVKDYRKVYGYDILEKLPELVWDISETEYSPVRYDYHNYLTDRFIECYIKNIADWAEDNHIKLTGHLFGEESLDSQTVRVGDVMRGLAYFQLPGMDILCDSREFTSAKQLQSVERQMGRDGAVSELYGVTNWDFSFRQHKMAGDWQAALGVTRRVHHLTWYSMRGEAKRDYPASIGYQSPWHQKYPLIENHFSRVNTALQSGKGKVRIGVIHPIESVYLLWGCMEHTFMKRKELEDTFQNITRWLLFGLLDFDFINEAMLENQAAETEIQDKLFHVGEMSYDVVLIPGCITLRENTISRLRCFQEAGGKVLFLGDMPDYVNGRPSLLCQDVYNNAKILPLVQTHVLRELEQYREIDIRLDDAQRPDNIIYQMREEGSSRWVFIAHAFEKHRITFGNMLEGKDIPYKEHITVYLSGRWNVTVYNTMDGSIEHIGTEFRDGRSIINLCLSIHDSLLLHLEEENRIGQPQQVPQPVACKRLIKNKKLNYPVNYSLSEPNVFLLDKAAYRLDDEVWKEEKDILKIDNEYRVLLGYPLKEESGAQPWTEAAEKKEHILELWFSVPSEIEADATLAAELDGDEIILWNGQDVENMACGWFIDEAIKKVRLPGLIEGNNELIIRFPYGKASNIESCYLLGDFGVEVSGKAKKVVPLPSKLSYGDICHQGLPFYGANMTYYCEMNNTTENDWHVLLKAPHFAGALLTVSLNGEERGDIAFAPYEIELLIPSKSNNSIAITVYGNRYNTLGQLHNSDRSYTWFASCSYRTSGTRWSDEYLLKASGLLVSPDVEIWEAIPL